MSERGFGQASCMRSLRLTLLLLAACAFALAPAAAARRQSPTTVMVSAAIGENAPKSMTQQQWTTLVYEYVNAAKIVPLASPALPPVADCRASGALYAIVAVFEGATRLPGIAQDPDRKTATARIDVENCLTGIVQPTRAIRVQSDPLSRASEGDFEPNSEITWNQSIRTALAREPLTIAGVARIIKVDAPFVLIDANGSTFTQNQVLRIFADRDMNVRPPLELVVSDVSGRYVQALWDQTKTNIAIPHVGDLIEPTK